MFEAEVPIYDETVSPDTDGLKTVVGMVLGGAVLIGTFGAANWLVNEAADATGTSDQISIEVIE